MRMVIRKSMLKCSLIMLAAAIFPAGCGELGIMFGLPVNRVVLRNDGKFSVNATLFVSSDEGISNDALTSVGTKIEYSIPPGESRSFDRNCADMRAIVIDEAQLDVVGGGGPTAHTDVLRDGADFNCRSTIEFVFDHSDIVLDFHITTTVRDNSVLDSGGSS